MSKSKTYHYFCWEIEGRKLIVYDYTRKWYSFSKTQTENTWYYDKTEKILRIGNKMYYSVDENIIRVHDNISYINGIPLKDENGVLRTE